VILAGGQSRRLGTDKALLRLQGQTLLASTIERLRPLCQEIIVVTNSPRAHTHPSARLVGDLFPGMGSLGGIYSGLQAALTTYSVAVACDMPFLNAGLVGYMATLAASYDVVMPRVGDSLEPLHAIYSKVCLPYMKELLERNDLKIIDFLPHVRVRYVAEDELAAWDPQQRSFLNINTPQDLEKAQAILGQADTAPHP
jgi:molybdenum cofactor guanylyltransferase